MYIIKNALLSISRSKGRNILIGIIALAIAVSACVALSIKESASKAREDTLNNMTVTAQISLDRQSMMQNAMGDFEPGSEKPEPDRDTMKEMLQSGAELTLEEYETYAAAESVKNSYYNLSVTLNASGDLEPIDTMGTFTKPDDSDSQVPTNQNGFGGMMGGGREFGGMMGTQGDFTVVGYSSDDAMTDFISGNSTITDGVVFEENTTENNCIISQELATYNNLVVGNEITLANPNNTDETFAFKIVGIYTGKETADGGDFMGGFSTATDSSNQIFTSYEVLKAICDISNQSAEKIIDENSGMTTSTAVQGRLNYTYVFADVEAYEAFCEQVTSLGLSEDYTISSTDITEFENSLVPLENLSKTAGYFLLVVFIIGAVILVVINIFNIRERKYEIGVLTAIGMKKWKVATQFVTELFVVTLAAIIIGAGIGAVASVPVTNAMLKAQITSNQHSQNNITEGFGRDTAAGKGGMTAMTPPDMPNSNDALQNPDSNRGFGEIMNNIRNSTQNYISEVSYSTNFNVIAQLIGVGILLTLISSLAAVLFIMRYEPLKILTNRD